MPETLSAYTGGHRLVALVVPHVKTQRDLDFLFAGKTDPTKPHQREISNAIAPGSDLAGVLRRQLTSVK